MGMVGTAMARVRGMLGLGLLGSVAGVVSTVLRVTIESFMTYGLWPLPIEVSMAATAGALGGFFFGAGFGVTLAALSSRRGLQELSLRRVAVLGAAVGAAVPAGLILVVSGPDVFRVALPAVLSASATWAAFGGIVAPAMVAAAQRAERTELKGVGGQCFP